jgi:hypothetical protein
MLRGALETRWSRARRALRPLTDAEWTFGKLTLGARLCASGGGYRGQGAGVAGQENERRNRRELVEEREYSQTTRRTLSHGCISTITTQRPSETSQPHAPSSESGNYRDFSRAPQGHSVEE